MASNTRLTDAQNQMPCIKHGVLMCNINLSVIVAIMSLKSEQSSAW